MKIRVSRDNHGQRYIPFEDENYYTKPTNAGHSRYSQEFVEINEQKYHLYHECTVMANGQIRKWGIGMCSHEAENDYIMITE